MWKHENIISEGGDADMSENAEWELESNKFQNHQASLHLPSPPLEYLTKEGNSLFNEESERITFQEFQKHTAEHEEENTEMELFCWPKHSFGSLEGSFAECLPIVPWKIDHDPCTSDHNFSSKETYFLENSFLAAGRSSIIVDGDFLSSQLGKEFLKIESGVSNGLPETALFFDRDKFGNELEVSKDIRNPCLQSCSLGGCQPFGGVSFAGEEQFESIGGFKNKRMRICCDERTDFVEADIGSQSFDLFSRSLGQGMSSSYRHLPRLMTKRDIPNGIRLLSRASLNLFPSYGKTNILSDSFEPVDNSGSDHCFLSFERCSKVSEPFSQSASRDDGPFTYKTELEGTSRVAKAANYRQFADGEEDCKFSYNFTLKSPNQGKCTLASSESDFNEYDLSNKGFYEFHEKHYLPDKCFPEHFDVFTDEAEWLSSTSWGKIAVDHRSQKDQSRYQNCESNPIPKERSRRSHSAPPFYRHKRKYISLNPCSTVQSSKPRYHTLHCAETSPVFAEAGLLKRLQQYSGVDNINIEPSPVEHLLFNSGPYAKKSNTPLDMTRTPKGEKFRQSECAQAHHAADVEDFSSKEIWDSIGSGTKWWNSHPQTTNKNVSCDIHQEDTILDISSGLLHLAGNSLIPESIKKNCLKDAKVLQQVDKKFIPVVAGGTLAVIDQHAADERIRLEELRQKVLSGEGKTVTYLDDEQELVLPEIGYQLLHNYAEQIKDWGWICNIHTHGSNSFKKNLNILRRQPAIVSLLAVPCILGVNLCDVDLLEFLQQLSDTDGSSTIPPSVLRVLNSKACRGAIMFGDSLLHSECALIVEELKQTSLCFQCAHGRPTTVPLVNLEALHKQIAQLGVLDDNSTELWHGLRQHGISLDRTRQRLTAARAKLLP